MAGLIFWIDKEVRELKVQPLASQTGDSAFTGKEIKTEETDSRLLATGSAFKGPHSLEVPLT